MKSNLPQHSNEVDCNFIPEDMVVKIHGDDDALYVFAMQSEINPAYGYIGEPDAECGECIALADIRTAFVAETILNCRLPDPSQLFVAADIQKHQDRAVLARGEVA